MFTEDLDPFFSDFAEAVTISNVVGTAIFSNEYAAQMDTVATASPSLMVRQSDYPPSLVGAIAVVRSVQYTVVNVEPDGTGVAVLRLERV